MFLKELKLILKSIFLDENYFEIRDISKSDLEIKYLVVVDQEVVDDSLRPATEIFEAIQEIISFKTNSVTPNNRLEIIFEVYSGY
ncbi:hypothetical protein [Spiroplasma alleghenense]|uniref:Uncharacterized protein n=1 Tax=Spiroplasma alleghenense TaxID=216931 RepID=A0A345Z376_9MOLU|nr:hypothetical protein [Spiroplasma alleghenense]AXK51055.1 hypothetical protein SALLE_v1c03810 [Spiroplasma alleghenense]